MTTSAATRDGINVKVSALAAALPSLEFSPEGSVVLDKKVYIEHLPEGMDIKTVDIVHAHDTAFTDATGLRFGEESIAFMKKNPKITRTTFKAPAGTMTVEGALDRDKTSRNPTTNETTDFKGALNHGISYKNAKGKGQMKNVKLHLRALADEEL